MRSHYSTIYFLTWNCNLACSYCYETRGRQNMSWEVARDGVDFFFRTYPNVHFQFFGGEPLLRFDLMQRMGDYLNSKYNGRYSLSIFTNGTLIDDNVVNYFKDNRVFVTLSMDGSGNTQDENRRFRNGRGTFETLEPILERLVDSGIPLRIRMTVTPNNCQDLFGNVRYFVEKYSLTDIQEEIDRCTYWEEQKISVLVDEYDKLINYVVDHYRSDSKFCWDNFERRIYPFVNDLWKRPAARCGSSEGMCSMDTDGTLYPCQKFIVQHSMPIGDIYQGFNQTQRDIVRRHILPNYLEVTRGCRSCEFVNYCFAGCIADNHFQDTNQTQDCRFRRLHLGMHKRFSDALIGTGLGPRKYTWDANNRVRFQSSISCGAEGCGAEGGAPSGCGAEGCGMEGGCGGEGCGAEGCGMEG